VKVALAALAGLVLLPTAADAAGPRISAGDGQKLTPRFAPKTTDYVVRCEGAPLSVAVEGAAGWEARIGPGELSTGDLEAADEGTRAAITARRTNGKGKQRRYYVSCLPADFPDYDFKRSRPGGPELFTMQFPNQYAAIMNGDGIPIWWYKASGEPDNVEVLRDGTIAFAPVDAAAAQSADYEVHNLKGRLLRKVTGGGGVIADIHELLLLKNGNYVLGAADSRDGVDATPYGGEANSSVLGIDIQEVTPKGKVVWNWSSDQHIGLEETGRWWPSILNTEPYDIVHWNSVDVKGNRVLLSFRHLDAVYMLNRKTGEIVWKLGGTETPESLTVLDDPEGQQALGGNHDARFNRDGTISIFDNNSGLNLPPRAVRYEIDEEAGTARLVESLTDPDVPGSFCCGSSRRAGDGSWLVAWPLKVGAYDKKHREIFGLTIPGGFPYRSLPVNERYASVKELRRAMIKRKG
jgi:hypothetical protein